MLIIMGNNLRIRTHTSTYLSSYLELNQREKHLSEILQIKSNNIKLLLRKKKNGKKEYFILIKRPVQIVHLKLHLTEVVISCCLSAIISWG